MKLKIIKIGDREALEVSTSSAKIVIGFGEDLGTGELCEETNPGINGLTVGTPSYDGIFIVRNPENSNLVNHALKEIPIYLQRKVRISYDISSDFMQKKKRENIIEMSDAGSVKIKDLEITSFIIDNSNHNTSMILVKSPDKSILVTGDFRNYESTFEKEKLELYLRIINQVDYLIMEGKYIGKYGIDYSSGKEVLEKLKNIMKFYKQVFVIQSETDLITSYNMYMAALKTNKIFIESTLVSNIASLAGGSAPNPVSSKKVYTYNSLSLENENFDFRKKYVTPFYIHSANNKMKKEKYVINVTQDMMQDVQLFQKEGSIYDGCIIFSMWKGYLAQNKELEEFVNMLKQMDMDYYELYSRGRVNMDIIGKIINRTTPRNVIPLDFNTKETREFNINNLKLLKPEEEINV